MLEKDVKCQVSRENQNVWLHNQKDAGTLSNAMRGPIYVPGTVRSPSSIHSRHNARI